MRGSHSAYETCTRIPRGAGPIERLRNGRGPRHAHRWSRVVAHAVRRVWDLALRIQRNRYDESTRARGRDRATHDHPPRDDRADDAGSAHHGEDHARMAAEFRKRLWVSLVYPMVWIVVVLIRGATDGWVPYPFLNPDTGYALVFTYVAGIAVLTIVTAAFVWALSRLQVVEMGESVNVAAPRT